MRAHAALLVIAMSFGAVDSVRAQTGAIAGVVKTAAGAPVPGAAVDVRPLGRATVRVETTDSLGRFAVPDLRADRYELRITRLGFADATRVVSVRGAQTATVEITFTEEAVTLEGVTVEVERARQRFETEAGTTSRGLSNADLKLIPGLAESDVLRAIDVLPGVVTTSDFSSAYNVRGGGADENLILLDGMPIYNPFHMGGLFSVFNSDMVAHAELMSGGFPAEFGTRVSSVLNVESDPTGSGYKADAGVSLLATRVALGADLSKSLQQKLGLRSARGKISVRRSYFDALLKPFVTFPYHLTDVQAYGEAWTAGGSRLTFTGYTGDDVVKFTDTKASFPLHFDWDWGNDMAGLRFTTPLGGKRTLDIRGGYSRFNTAILFPDFDDTQFRSRIDQTMLRADADVIAGDIFNVRTGLDVSRIGYDNLAQTGGTVFRKGRQNGLLAGAYAQMRWHPNASWLVETGGRLDEWKPSSGPSGAHPAPRVAIKRFLSSGNAALKLSVGRYTQFVHSVRDEEFPIGIDVWVTAGDRAPVVVSDQIETGYERFFGKGWSTAIEAYYRKFNGVTTNNYADDPNNPLDDLLAGHGRSYGADMMLKRVSAKTNGWLSVSYLKATRSFPDFVSGLSPAPEITYPPIFDRRLDVELVLRYVLPHAIESGVRVSYGSGLPFTKPLATYSYMDYQLIRNRLSASFGDDSLPNSAVLLGPRNGSRYPSYQRVDMSFRKTFQKNWGRMIPYLDIINVFNRKNVLFYFYDYATSPATRSGASMFPILPTIGMDLSF